MFGFSFIHTQYVMGKGEREVIVTEWPDKLKQELENYRAKNAGQDLNVFDKTPKGIAIKNIQLLRNAYVTAGDNKKLESALRDLVVSMDEVVKKGIFKSSKPTNFLDNTTHDLFVVLVKNLKPGMDFSSPTLK